MFAKSGNEIYDIEEFCSVIVISFSLKCFNSPFLCPQNFPWTDTRSWYLDRLGKDYWRKCQTAFTLWEIFSLKISEYKINEWPWFLLFQNENLVIVPPFPPDGRTAQAVQKHLNTFISTNKKFWMAHQWSDIFPTAHNCSEITAFPNEWGPALLGKLTRSRRILTAIADLVV